MGKHDRQRSGRCFQVQTPSSLRDCLAEGCLVMQRAAAALCVASPAKIKLETVKNVQNMEHDFKRQTCHQTYTIIRREYDQVL